MEKSKAPKRWNIKTSEQGKKPVLPQFKPVKNFSVSYTRTNRKGGRK